MTPDQVTFTSAGGGADRFRALMAGIVKSTATASEFEPEAAKHGLNVLARAHEVTPHFARNCIVTTQAVIDKKGDQLARFLAATMDGTAYALSHRDQTLALTRKVANLEEGDPAPAFMFDDAVRLKALNPTLPLPMDSFAWFGDMLLRNGVIDAPFDPERFVDRAPREAALGLRKP